MTQVDNAVAREVDVEPRWIPELPAPLVDRPHLITTLEAALSSSSVIFLQGDDGDGVSTLLAQFALQHRTSTISLFIKPASRASYSADYLRRLLAEQYSWHLKKEVLSVDIVGAELFDALGLKLRVNTKARKRTLYFVVDGVHQIPADDRRILESIFRDILPVGLDGFKFIISGRQSDLAPLIGKENSTTQQMVKLSSTEAKLMFEGVSIKDEELAEIVEVCGGTPGKLTAVRRLIGSGTSWSALALSPTTSYPNFIKEEFSELSRLESADLLAIAVLAHSRHQMSAAELADTIQSPDLDGISSLLERCTFLRTDRETSGVEFRSEAHRRIAEKETESLRGQCHKLQVDRLLKAPSSAAALRFLPTYYQQLGNAEALVKLLAHPSHYIDLLNETQSLKTLQARAAMGFRSARELEILAHILQFSVQRSIFSSLSPASDSPSEIAALVAMGQSQQALALSARSTTKEGRLMLISEYARGVCEKAGSNLDPAVVIYIKELVADVDFSGWGDSAIAIAENLLKVDLDLALSIVDEALEGEGATRHSDAVYAKLSVDASFASEASSDLVKDKVDNRISSDDLRAVVSSVKSFFRDFTIDQVIKLVSGLKIERKIYLLRSLAVMARKKPEALRIVDYALNEMIAASSYRPKAEDLADLSTPLAHASPSDIPPILQRIQTQIELIDSSTSSRHSVALQMKLALAESKYDAESAKTRIEDAFLFSSYVENMESQLLCLSTILNALSELDGGDLAGFCTQIAADVNSQLEDRTDDLLERSADHLKIFTPIIDSLCVRDPQRAITLVARFNLERARNEGMVRVAAEVARHPLTEDRCELIAACLGRLKGLYRDAAVQAVNLILQKLPSSALKLMLTRRMASMISSPELVCEMQIKLLEAQDCGSISSVDVYLSKLESQLESIDELVSRVDICFKASAALANRGNRAEAETFYKKADDLRRSAIIATKGDADLLLACLSLTSRSIRPLIRLNMNTDEMIRRIGTLRDLHPSVIARAYVSAELVIRAWCEGKGDLATSIYDEYCAPILNATESAASWDQLQTLAVNVVMATYCVHRNAAFQLFNTHVPAPHRSRILENLCLLVLRKIPPTEPRSSLDDEFHRSNYNVALDILEILEHAPDDVTFARCLSYSCTVFGNRKNKENFTAQQRSDFRDRVSLLIAKKLPDQQNIKHDGYVIVSKAYLGRMVEYKQDEWRILVTVAESIPNVADRCFVYLEICACLPQKSQFDNLRKELLEKANATIEVMPSIHDRYSRLEMYVSTARKFDVAEATAALKRAARLSMSLGTDGDASSKRRALVDLAELVKSGMAEELADAIDDDPARADAKAEIRKAAEVQKLKRDIATSKRSYDAHDTEHLPSAAWKNLGSLLVNRLETQTPDAQIELLEQSAKLPLEAAYPIISFYLENMGKRFTTDRDADKFLVPASEVVMLCAEMAGSAVSAHHRSAMAVTDSLSKLSKTSAELIVLPGNRHAALEYINAWLRSNCGESIIYCDPYFSETDLEFLKFVLSANPSASVTILTSRNGINLSSFSAESYYSHWRTLNDTQDPPRTEIIALGNAGSGPIHDRWIISGDCGLGIGTSFNSIGSKLSEIRPLDDTDAIGIAAELRKYCMKERIIGGQRIDYLTVNL